MKYKDFLEKIKKPKEANTIEDMLRSREKAPVLTLAVFKDVCRRIKKLEAKSMKKKNLKKDRKFISLEEHTRHRRKTPGKTYKKNK